MSNDKSIGTVAQKEFVAELLKERIYATLALLAVLISIDTAHATPIKAEFLIIGTIVSLWAASIVATQMSRRMIFQGELDAHKDGKHQIRKHAPMLATLVFPVFMILLSMLKLVSLSVAINISIASALLLLAIWSIVSARSLKSTRIPVVILVAFELTIGLAIVGLKVAIGHWL